MYGIDLIPSLKTLLANGYVEVSFEVHPDELDLMRRCRFG